MQDQVAFSPHNLSDKIAISTPKFEGVRSLNAKNNKNQDSNLEIDKLNLFENEQKSIKNKIIFSEKKKENKYNIDYKINNSTDNKKYFSSIFHNYQKMKKDNINRQKQISFDEKSDNYLFTNEINNNKKENENNNDSFNYDLPLEMDKSSEIFNFNNFNLNQQKNENSKFQEYNYNYNNIFNNDKSVKMPINIRKINNSLNLNNKIVSKEKNKKYFSFDGENQISEENKLDKSKDKEDKEDNENKDITDKDNIDNIKNNNNHENENKLELKLFEENGNGIDSEHIINISNNFNQNESAHNDLNNNSHIIDYKKYNINEIKENINIEPNSKKIIFTPKKEYISKLKLLKSEDKSSFSKNSSIKREKKLINKNLIGYLAFNTSNSIQSKSSILYDDSFSYISKKKDKNKDKEKDKQNNNINDSIDKLNKNKKISITKSNSKKIKPMQNFTEATINLQFNNYLNRSRNLTMNNNIKKCFTNNEKVYRFIAKNKTLPSKNSNYSQNSFNSFIDLKNYNKISKVKNKNIIKFCPKFKHEKNISTLNVYKNNNNTIKNNFIQSRNNGIEFSNTFDDNNNSHKLYYTINLNNNKSNEILIDKRNNTLKNISYPHVIKVNKINTNQNNNIKKDINKIAASLNSNQIYTKLPFTNSSKVLKIKNKMLYSLNIENKDTIKKKNYIHKTSKITSINNLKNRIESFKKMNKERLSSYENLNNINNLNNLNININESKKEIFNKKKIVQKNKISLDKNIKNKLNLMKTNNNKMIKSRNYNNSIIQKKYLTSFPSQTLKETNHFKLPTFQNDKLIHIPFSSKTKNNKMNHSKNKKSIIDKNINIKNKINKKINIKQKTNYFNSVDIKQSSINKINQDIIKYSIIRNNHNNQVSNVISVTIGNNIDKEIPNINNNYVNSRNENFKKTIINVNQYYPNYYINTNNLDKNIHIQSKNKFL